MRRLDRYILGQMSVMFGFFSLVLVGVYWVNQAVRLFDDLLADGQSTLVFLEFSALVLPNIMRITLGVAAFAAAISVAIRLSNDSELAAMTATGVSPARLIRPAVMFAASVFVLLSVITHKFIPVALERFEQRQAEVATNLAAQLLQQGSFIFPSRGVTFLVGDIDDEGRLNTVFVSDTRDPGREVTYNAREAYLVRQDSVPTLVMVDGLAQIYRSAERRMSVTSFVDLTFSLEGLVTEPQSRIRLRHVSTWELITDPIGVSETTGRSLARISDELHGRFAEPLLAAAGAVFGFVVLITAPFHRTGNTRAVVWAVGAMILVKFSESAVTGLVREAPENWPLAYGPTLLTLLLIVIVVARASASRRPFVRSSEPK